MQFLGKSIESWFDVRVDRALEGGLNLGRSALDYLLKDTTNKAGQIALTLSEAAPGSAVDAPQPRGRAGRRLRGDAVFGDRAACSPSRGSAVRRAPPEPPPAQALRRARLQQPTAAIEQTGDGGLVLRVVTPVNSDDRLEPLKVLQVLEPVPKALAQEVEKVQAGSRDYQEIRSRGSR